MATLAQEISRLLRKHGFEGASLHHSHMIRGCVTISRPGFECRTERCGKNGKTVYTLVRWYARSDREDREAEMQSLLRQHGYKVDGLFVERPSPTRELETYR